MKSRVEETTNPSKNTRMFKKFGHGIVLTPRNLSTTTKEDQVNHYNLSTGVVTTHPSTYQTPFALKTTPPIIPDNLKPDTPSKLRQLLPVLLCVISFATVMSILIVYIDTTEIRHQQFRLNMTRDYDLLGVQQDNPSLIAYIREVHMKKYPNMVTNFLANSGPAEHLNFTNSHELTPKLASDIASLVGNKQKGVFFQSLTGSSGPMMTAPWLAETLGWTGYIVEPDPRKYFALRKDNARRNGVQVIHACLSPTGYPKEVTLHHEDLNDVKITSVTDEEDWFHSRVKCFPLYTLLLAVNHTQIDVLSLGCQGQELEILQTIPWNKVQINVISLHLNHNFDQFEMETAFYTKRLINFMRSRFYKLSTQVSHNLIFTKIGSARNL